MDALGNGIAVEGAVLDALAPVFKREVRVSRSFLDVRHVDGGHTATPPPLRKVKRSSMCNLLAGQLKAVQEHENDVAEVIIVSEPEGTSLMMGGLHPRGSLYERPVNIERAKSMHAEFRNLMRDHGVKVLTVREILAFGVNEHVGARIDLEELAMEALTYDMSVGAKLEDLTEPDRFYLSNEYKRQVIEHMSIEQLIDCLLTNPVVHIMPSYRDTGLTASYSFRPLSNLVYTRDQQVTTCKGLVMGRLRSEQRQREVQLMKFCFNKLGLPVVGEIVAPGYLEGGDFFPMGKTLALVGIGLRSNFEACQQLMDQDLLGADRLGVVRDDFDKHQDRMHLDCVFSVLGDNVCIMLETIMGENSPTRRLVDEYVRDKTGKYRLLRADIEFSEYMENEGFHIIPISAEDQLQYACNVLNLGDGRVISVHAKSARQMIRSGEFKGDIQVIDFSSITSMYGSVHCASQVVKRIPRSLMQAVDGTSNH